jgi:hypothetical protein
MENLIHPLTLCDLLNVAYKDGVECAIREFNLPTAAAGPLNNWIQAQDHVLELEKAVARAATIVDDIADFELEPIFAAAMEVAA